MLKRATLIAVVFMTGAALAATPKQGNYLQWGDSPEAYFFTTQERGQWDTILSKEEADKFIEKYWARHGEAFHQDLLARIAAADKYFGIADRKGSMTERGRVFIILGSPTREQTTRNSVQGGGFATGPGGPNSIDRQAIVYRTWTYKKDRLPADLAVPELTINFQTDVQRGYETIENPGIIEPDLKRYADWYMAKLGTPQQAPASTPQVPAPAPAPSPAAAASVDAALWTATANLHGAYFTGDPFVSPTEKTFYAYSFYLPQSVATLAGTKDVVLVGSIRDASGTQVATFRNPATPASYDETGDRYADGAVELAPGKYSGVFALYTSDGSTLLANARSDFDVPAADAARVSRPFLTSHIDTLDKQGVFDPWTFVAMKYAVKGNSTFRKSDAIGWFTYIANPTANPNPQMTMRMKVSRDGKVVDQSPTMPAELQQTGPHTYLLATRFDPNTLQPGKYSLELTLKDQNAKKDYVQTVDFTVAP